MKNCVSGKILQIKIQELIQNLSNTEKKILVWWITHFTIIGFFVFLKLVLKIIKEIHQECLFFVFQVLFRFLKLHLIGYN